MAQMLRAKGYTIDKMGRNLAKKMVKEGVQVYRVSHPSKKTWEVEGENEKEAIRRYKDEVGLKSDAGIKTLLIKDVGEELEENAAVEIQKKVAKGGMDKAMFQKSVDLLKSKKYDELKTFLKKSDTSPREYVMDVIAKKEPSTFKKMYGNQTGYYSLMNQNELDEGLKIANLVGQSIAHLGMYVELAEDVKKQYPTLSSFTKIKAEQVLRNVPKLIKELRRPGIWSEEYIAEALRDMEDYRAKSKTLQDIQNDPKQMSDPEMKVAVMKRKEKLNRELQDLKAKQARQKPIAAEVEPGTIVKEEYTIEAPFSVEYKGTKNAKEKQRGANIAREVGGKIKVDASDEDGAKRMVKRILTKRMNKGDEYLRRFELGQVRAENFKSFREAFQQGFAVRYSLDGKRLVQAYKTQKDAEHRAKILKSMGGVKDVSITKHNLNFKEDYDLTDEYLKMLEGFEWHTLSFLKRKGFNVARFSYGKLLVPKSDVEDVKKVLEKEYNKRDGDIFELPQKIVGESSFEDLKHKSQPVEVREQFTTSQLNNLKKQWAQVKTVNPTGEKYKALVKWINDKEFDMVDQLAKAKINFVSYIAKKALMDKWGFKKDTINKMYGGLLSNQYENLSLDKVFKEVSPPGWEGSVRAMKKHPELGGEDGKDGKNIYALAWYLKNKGAKPHYKDKGGKPVKKDKYKNEQTEHEYAQQISGVENEGRKETINE